MVFHSEPYTLVYILKLPTERITYITILPAYMKHDIHRIQDMYVNWKNSIKQEDSEMGAETLI